MTVSIDRRAPLLLACLARAGFAALLLAACGPAPGDELAKALVRSASWGATARMVAEQWDRGALSERYSFGTISAAQKSLDEERSTIEKIAATDAGLVPTARGIVAAASRSAGVIEAAMRAGDHAAAARQIPELGRTVETLLALSRTAGGTR